MEYYLGLLPGIIPSARAAPPAPGLGRRRARRAPSARSCSPGRGCWPRSATLIPDPRAEPPDPLHDHRARARRRAQPRHPGLRRRLRGWRPLGSKTGVPPALRRGRGPRTRSAPRTCRRSTTWWTPSTGIRARTPVAGAGDREDQRRGVRLRQRARSTWPALPAPGAADEAGRSCAARILGHASRRRPTSSVDDFLAAFERPRRDRGGADHRRRVHQPQRADAGASRRHGRAALDARPAARGASGQKYLGCVFPADPAYARKITEPALAIGRCLAEKGVLGRFAVDFVTVQDEHGRVGGLRDRAQPAQGRHDPPVPDAAVPRRRRVRRRRGRLPHGVGRHQAPRGDRPPRGRPAARAHRHATCSTSWPGTGCTSTTRAQTGVVFHMISCVTECGRLGMTAIGDSPRGGVADLPGRHRRAAGGGRAGRRAGEPPVVTGAESGASLVRRLRVQPLPRPPASTTCPAAAPPGSRRDYPGCRDSTPPASHPCRSP